MIKKLLIGLLFFVALFLASFQAGSTEQEKIRIGVDPSYPPFSEVDEAGKLKGFDIEIAQALCDKLNVECEFFQIKWNELIQQLRAGTFDAIVSSMSITEKRRESVAFTERYYSNLVQFVVHKDSNFDPNELTGHTIGVAPGTVSSIWLEDNVADIATIKHFTEADSIFEALKSVQEVPKIARRQSEWLLATTQGLLASSLASDLNGVIGTLVEGAPTIYDKAMDAQYIATHVGGSFHRLFDGGHTLFGAFYVRSCGFTR